MSFQPLSLEQRLESALSQLDPVLAEKLREFLQQQQFIGRLSETQVKQLCQISQLTPQQLALTLLPIAACYATVPVSQFYVGAIALGASGTFYFGANQEFAGVSIQHTIHAEQSAISHAWLVGEESINEIAVNYTPCGHCRQFMNELNSAETLQIHLPHQQNNLLHNYLPDAFGPKDLNIQACLFDKQHHHLNLSPELATKNDPVLINALKAANNAHAPYSQSYCGVAIQLDNGELFQGQYIENAAFNPSLPALQTALNLMVLSGKTIAQLSRVVMVEKVTHLQQKKSAEQLLSAITPVKLEYYSV